MKKDLIKENGKVWFVGFLLAMLLCLVLACDMIVTKEEYKRTSDELLNVAEINEALLLDIDILTQKNEELDNDLNRSKAYCIELQGIIEDQQSQITELESRPY